MFKPWIAVHGAELAGELIQKVQAACRLPELIASVWCETNRA
jgi:hypothetical protein